MKKKDQKQKQENSQSAHDTLIDIIASLQKISNIDDSSNRQQEEETNEIENISTSCSNLSCVFCKNPIQRSDYIVSLKCCGEIAHIKCFAKLSSDQQTEIRKECPKCKGKFNKEQVNICQRICSMIPD